MVTMLSELHSYHLGNPLETAVAKVIRVRK